MSEPQPATLRGAAQGLLDAMDAHARALTIAIDSRDEWRAVKDAQEELRSALASLPDGPASALLEVGEEGRDHVELTLGYVTQTEMINAHGATEAEKAVAQFCRDVLACLHTGLPIHRDEDIRLYRMPGERITLWRWTVAAENPGWQNLREHSGWNLLWKSDDEFADWLRDTQPRVEVREALLLPTETCTCSYEDREGIAEERISDDPDCPQHGPTETRAEEGR